MSEDGEIDKTAFINGEADAKGRYIDASGDIYDPARKGGWLRDKIAAGKRWWHWGRFAVRTRAWSPGKPGEAAANLERLREKLDNAEEVAFDPVTGQIVPKKT